VLVCVCEHEVRETSLRGGDVLVLVLRIFSRLSLYTHTRTRTHTHTHTHKHTHTHSHTHTLFLLYMCVHMYTYLYYVREFSHCMHVYIEGASSHTVTVLGPRQLY
jgi:hypothetical protein